MINVESIIYLKVLSPIHIGGAQEKNLQEGLDFFDNYRIIEKEVYHPERGINPDALADAFISGNRNALAELIRNQPNWKQFVTEIKGSRGSTGDIKAFIKSGADGKAYIPGSSIKGAIRSAVAHYLCGGSSTKNPDELFIKDFEASIFRFIKVFDTNKFETVTFNSKIGSIKDNGKLGWKQKGGKNSFSFEPEKNPNEREKYKWGFDTIIESPSINTILEFSINITIPKFLLKFQRNFNYQRGNKLVTINEKSFRFIIEGNPINSILNAIKSESVDHLDREIIWFKKYKGDQSNRILEQLDEFKKLTLITDNSLFRFGFGNGFHSMTGDWLYQNHTDVGFWNNGKPKYKTRRIAFDKWPNPRYFGPMGFVLLSLTPFKEKETKETSTEPIKLDLHSVVEIKPVHRNVTIKAGVILEGVVRENKMIDVYMPDGSIKTVKLVSGSADPGKVIEVAIFPEGKGNFQQASFKGYKK